MRGKLTLYVDQYGNRFQAKTVAELREKIGGGKVSKMYRDTDTGAEWIGYVVGRHWCTAYLPFAVPV